MRNLRRWLRRQVIKHEGIRHEGIPIVTSSNRSRLTRSHLAKVATMLLMSSGLFLSGTQTAEAARTFERVSELSLVSVNATPDAVDIDADGDNDLFSGDYQGAIFFWENTGSVNSPVTHAE